MPIFQDDLAGEGTPPAEPTIQPAPGSPLDRNIGTRRLSEESIRTELCEGPILDILDSPGSRKAGLCVDPSTNFTFPVHETSDRAELIERLKKEKARIWRPDQDGHESPQTPSKPLDTPSLLLSPDTFEPKGTPAEENRQLQAGQEIERPRSALHSGDFTERPCQDTNDHKLLGEDGGLYTPEPHQWFATSPPRNFYPFQLESRFPPVDLDRPRTRPPSLSSSYSSSFIFKPPTSPLVQSETNEDPELSSRADPISITPGFQRNPRRHTLQASHSLHSTPSIPTVSSFGRPLPHLRRDNPHPYQAHQPRRSLTANQMPHLSSSPQTPASSRPRGPSFTSDSSPLHASMVGSYEESILRGRMSTTPSKPLDFVAQIGVLGFGKCKSSLRCPAHVTIPFPAVFYRYESTPLDRAGKSDDGPSPYVGQIDLENNLPNLDLSRDSRRKRHSINPARNNSGDIDMIDGTSTTQPSELDIRRAGKQKRRATSPRAPPGGSYRIPEKGQLQIIIKNPNKTAVKLFLVPYDLTGMEPGTKTFIRQRSYSTGPVIDSFITSSPQVPQTCSHERPTLRYLVHLHICSPSRARFYLYKSIRVVFANRVPDGKEKLRNEISLPDPRFSVYKPGRDSSLSMGMISGAGASLTADKAYRRRSSGFTLYPSHRNFDAAERAPPGLERGFGGSSTGPLFPPEQSRATPVQPIPFSLSRQRTQDSDDSGQGQPPDIYSPTSSRSSRPPGSPGSGHGSGMSWGSSAGIGGYDKLSKGDVGYGGNAFAGSPGGKQAGEGLLAQKLRGLGMGRLDHLDGL